MLRLLETLDATYYSPRSYIVAATDRMGAQHALASEQRRPSYKVLTADSSRLSSSVSAQPADLCKGRMVQM